MVLPSDSDPLACELCGLPIPGRRGKRAKHSAAQRFCCTGCYLTHRMTGTKGEEGRSTLALLRLGLAAFFAVNVMTLSWALYGDHLGILFPVEAGSRKTLEYLILALSLPVLLLAGFPYIRSAAEQLRGRRAGVDSLIALGTSSAFALSVWSTFGGDGEIYYDTACMVLVLVTLGRYLEANARTRATAALHALESVPLAHARIPTPTGELMVPLDTVHTGNSVIVLPGEIIPVDGEISEGETTVDESLLTGESRPVARRAGSRVLGGSKNYDGRIIVAATAVGEEMVMHHVAGMMRSARRSRGTMETRSDAIAGILTPVVMFVALLTLVYWILTVGTSAGLMNALSVLLIACPCALGIGAPLASSAGYARLARKGVLLRSLDNLERLGATTQLFFDKTGTLTRGRMEVSGISTRESPDFTERDMLDMIASVEAGSTHPVGKALAAYARGRGGSILPSSPIQTLPGLGIKGEVSLGSGRTVSVAVRKGDDCISTKVQASAGTPLRSSCYISFDEVVSSVVHLSDHLRPEAPEAVRQLQQAGISCTIVSGDCQGVVSQVARDLNIAEASGDLKPEEKIRLVQEAAKKGGITSMVGDGINDAPALAAADIGIALRGGTDLSREAADVTIMDDDLRKIPWAIGYSRKVLRTIKWNLGWAFAYNIIGIGLAACGLLHPVFSALAMIASSLLIVANSSRLAKG